MRNFRIFHIVYMYLPWPGVKKPDPALPGRISTRLGDREEGDVRTRPEGETTVADASRRLLQSAPFLIKA
jgi:hypothetical protein